MASPSLPLLAWSARRAGGRRAVALGFGLAIAGAALMVGAPQVLLNTTASEPKGLYRRLGAPPEVGRLVAFRAPASAFPYADAHLGYLRRVPLLKTVAAGPGDHVCAAGGRLIIAGQYRAPIAWSDRRGRVLPHWAGCRRLAPDELFVFSDRVPDSFDSRYFGPIARRDVLGVFAPLVIDRQGGR